MAKLTGETFDPATMVTNSFFSKLTRNNAVVGGEHMTVRVLLFHRLGEWLRAYQRQRGGYGTDYGSREAEAAAKKEEPFPRVDREPPSAGRFDRTGSPVRFSVVFYYHSTPIRPRQPVGGSRIQCAMQFCW